MWEGNRSGRTRVHRPSALVALVVFTLLVGVGLAAGLIVQRQVDRSAEQMLGQRADALRERTEAEVQRYAAALSLTAAGLAAAEAPTYAAFGTATAPLRDLALAGATSIVFIAAPAAGEDLDEFQGRWRAMGADGLVLDPNPELDTHVFSIYSDPLDGSATRRLGIDVAGAPAPFAALAEAARSGQVALSEPYQLIIDQSLPPEERQTSFSMVAPVLGPGGEGSEPLGWVLLGIRGQDFMGGVLRSASQDAVDVVLRAASGSSPDALVDVARVSSSGAGERDLRRFATIPAAQRTWTLEVDADSDELVGAGRYLPRFVLGAGLLVALLLAGLTYVLASGRARARQQVRIATRHLVEAEAESRRQAALLAAVLDSISDGVGVVDETGAFLIHNPAAKALLGVDEDKDGPDEWQEHYGLFTPTGEPFPVEDLPLVRALYGESADEVEMVVRNRARPEGVRIAVTGRPLDAAGQRGAVAVFRDVTVDREQRAELAAFAGVVAHDLRHPLTVIIGFLELIAVGEAGAGNARAADVRTADFVARALASAHRMNELIGDLLDYTAARDAGLAPISLDLDALARQVLDEHAARGRSEVVPTVHLGALPRVEADPVRMRQVLANLVGNAIKYTAPGQVPHVEITAVTTDDEVTVLVSDRGIGIPEDQRAAVFTPFHRAHAEEYAGTGLGLAICHRIVTRHGGTLTVRDNPGGGSIFAMTLPRGPTEGALGIPADVPEQSSAVPS